MKPNLTVVPKTDKEVIDLREKITGAEILRYWGTGREMQRNTADGETLKDLAHSLKSGMLRTIILEPGDATRYDLHVGIIPEQYLLVSRRVGARMLASAVSSAVERHEVEPITNGNAWTNVFLSWWIKALWLELKSL